MYRLSLLNKFPKTLFVQARLYTKQTPILFTQTVSNPEDGEMPLEWKQRFLEDGTAFYTHPTREQILSVKQYRLVQQKLSANPKKAKHHPWIKNYLTPEQIEEVQKLRKQDPWKYTSKVLAKMFNVRAELITSIDKEPVEKVKDDLKKLKELNKRKPKKGSKQHKNKY